MKLPTLRYPRHRALLAAAVGWAHDEDRRLHRLRPDVPDPVQRQGVRCDLWRRGRRNHRPRWARAWSRL